MDAIVVGRDAVLEQAWQSLTVRDRVLLEGPPGIGKTAVFQDVVARARAAGMLVLACAPTEAESALPLAALADVLDTLGDRLETLPSPQRAAAETALLSGQPGRAVDERALGAATRTLIDAAAAGATTGVLVAVDDAPWLDPPSERALRFALRRVSSDVAVLVTRRITDADAPSAPVGLDDATVTRVRLGPLGVGALQHLLSVRFEHRLRRPMLTRLAHECAGNPLVAIELARAVLRLPALPAPGDDLPIVASLHELVGRTLASLPVSSREAVRLASLLTNPTLATVAAAGVEGHAFDAVEEAGLVRIGDDEIRFVHPVHASAVRAGIPPGVRRRLHGRLAGVCTDPDERARQLARSAARPGADIAAELTAAAVRARSRGAPELAAAFYDRAADLTPRRDTDERFRRQLAAVRCRFDCGDYAAAGAQAESIAGRSSGDTRAQALLLQASIAWSVDDLAGATGAGSRALTAAVPNTRLAGRIHAHLALFVDLPGPARRHAEAARTILSRTPTSFTLESLDRDDHQTLTAALMLLFLNEVRAGEAPRRDLLEQALALEGAEPSWLAGTVPAIWWKGIDEHERARARLHWMLDRAVELGDEPFQHELLTHLGEAELLAGHYPAARRAIASAFELGEQLGSGLAGETWLRGMLDAQTGDLAAAGRTAAAGLCEAEATGDQWRRRINLQLTGVVALAADRAADAACAFAALAEAVNETGLIEPLGTRFEADWVEACVGAGNLATAAEAQRRLLARHALLPRPWTALGVARGEVLLVAAAGQAVDAALAGLDEARRAVPADVVPFDRARCLLVAGIAHRRARRKRLAREALQAAAAEFGALGARAYLSRARAELDRVGPPGSPPDELTPTEGQVARLAAAGRTGRAIAAELFISPKTVEANLARVYRKLGIASRAELGAVMSGRERAET